MNYKKILALAMVALLALTLTGCSSSDGSDKKEETSAVLNVMVAAPYVDDDMLAGLKEELTKVDVGTEIVVTGVTMSDSEKDPMGFMAGMARVSGSIAAKEVDILITDADNARRVGDNGECYLAINDTFTASEIEKFTSGLACVSIVGEDGEITDEVSAPCGVRLSESASALASLKDMQMFIVSNTQNTDAAKKVFTHLAAY